jgi:hypothetical protein
LVSGVGCGPGAVFGLWQPAAAREARTSRAQRGTAVDGELRRAGRRIFLIADPGNILILSRGIFQSIMRA